MTDDACGYIISSENKDGHASVGVVVARLRSGHSLLHILVFFQISKCLFYFVWTNVLTQSCKDVVDDKNDEVKLTVHLIVDADIKS